jgi:hypothetical protein
MEWIERLSKPLAIEGVDGKLCFPTAQKTKLSIPSKPLDSDL